MRTRFWLRPAWVVGHILCVLLIILFVNLGFWQLRRLDFKRDRNALIEAREQVAATTVAEATRDGADAAAYRRVRVRGHWDTGETVLIRSRALNEQAGYDVVTPLVADDGTTVIVNRGFAPNGEGGEAAIFRVAQPKEAEVEVQGLLRPSEERGRFEPKDRPGQEKVINRIDLRVLQAQSSHHLAPVYLQLTASDPSPGAIPIPRPLPVFDEGPHLSYAVQWFIFATVGAVGWPLLLRKRAREQDNPDEEGDID